jgi:Excalibur calcium-binding domain
MKKRLVAVLVAGMFALPTVGASSAVAIRSTDRASSTVAAPSFDNCTQMHRRWQYGVAKSQRAARRQVQTGHYRPRVSSSGYRANSSLDADNDGTECEVSV